MSIRWLVPIAAASWRRLRSAIPVSRAWPTAAASSWSRACVVRMPQCTVWYMYHLVHKGGRMARLHAGAQGVTRAAQGSVWTRAGGAGSYRVRGPAGASGDQCLGDRAAVAAARTPAAERGANAAGHTVSTAPNPSDPKGESDDHHVSRPGGFAVSG